MVYYAYFHPIIYYGIIFWGNSSYATNIFCVQKRVLRIMTGNRNSCRQLFKTRRILPLRCQYIYSLLCLWLITWIHINLYQIYITEIQGRVTILIFINPWPIYRYITRGRTIWVSGCLIVFLYT